MKEKNSDMGCYYLVNICTLQKNLEFTVEVHMFNANSFRLYKLISFMFVQPERTEWRLILEPMKKQIKTYQEQNHQITKDVMAIFKNSTLFKGFSEEELRKLLPVLQPVLREYTKGSIIIDEGETSTQIGFVVDGKVVARKMTIGGHIHILEVHDVGDNFGFEAVFSAYRTSPLTYTAETDCIILFTSAAIFFNQEDKAGIKIMINVNRILADRCVRLLYKTDVLSKQSLRQRILTFFNIMGKKSKRDTFFLKMTREQFAQYLCVNRSALSRELSRMQKEGLIELKQGGEVSIRNIDIIDEVKIAK